MRWTQITSSIFREFVTGSRTIVSGVGLLGVCRRASGLLLLRISDHREREDRAIVNGQIGHREREDRAIVNG